MPFNNYAPQYIFRGQVQSDTAPSDNNDLVRKQDVSGLSFISSIASGSSSYLSVSGGELSVSSLLISDVHVDNSQSSLANFISNESSTAANLKKGDFLVLTAATGGAETYIVSGADGSNAANYTEVESGLTASEIVAKLSAGAGISISAGGQISSTITQYTDSNARASLSGGAGISYNNSTGQISSSITQYTDSNARAALSAGTGLTYNSSTGQFACSITQYADSNARAAISATGNISYDSSTGVISTSLTQYADANARAALSAGAGISYNSSTGQISCSITQYTDANARAAFSGGKGINLANDGELTVDFSEFTTTDMVEGLKLYFTDARARSAFSYGDGIAHNGSGVLSLDLGASSGLAFSSGALTVKVGDGLGIDGSNKLQVDAGTGLAIDGSDKSVMIDNDYFRRVFENQSFTANSAKTINHALSEKYVQVSVYDSSDNLVHAEVSLTDANNLTVTTSDALTGVTVVVSI
jgi:hypothetical protein|tara:strand:- start:2069 stop:3490 length:1422 start_codon:yes stop_codon:yes gene_type:complete